MLEKVIRFHERHTRGADHHKDDISVDFDRVCCQILDDSIAVGETETIHFLLGRFSVLLWSERKKGRKNEKREKKESSCREVRNGPS